MGRAVEASTGGRLVTLPCVTCHGSGYVDDREAWSDQEYVPGVRREYLEALEKVAEAARTRIDDPWIVAALADLDAVTVRKGE